MAERIIMPRLGDFMTEGTVAKWAKASGETVAQGEVIAEIESEKLNYELEATRNGILHTIAAEGDTVQVDVVMAYLLDEGEAPPEPDAPAAAPVASASVAPASAGTKPAVTGATVPSTPGARRLAAKMGIDIAQVTPTGPRGRVIEADVRGHTGAPEAEPASATPPGLGTPASTAPIEGMRKTIADHMRRSIADTAQLSFFLELDVTEAQRLRREHSANPGATISLAHVLIKACAESLRRNPKLNSILAGGNVHYYDEVNVGVAVSLDEGLIVPVVKGVESMDIAQLATETTELAERARTGSLSSNDLVGGTFTVSVLGSVDGFTPILNAGQSAILGAGRSVEKPVVRRGEVVVREMMTISLTVDHQVIDGAVAAAFLRRLQQFVERPAALFE
jgi:pyruvate dehydrogenase E2 component (dihydrolipoamide acetyltransferase)